MHHHANDVTVGDRFLPSFVAFSFDVSTSLARLVSSKESKRNKKEKNKEKKKSQERRRDL